MVKIIDISVSAEKEKALLERMLGLGVGEQDIIESFIRSRGPGGQNVNKSSTCVYLKHIPTGIEVKCQKERSQALNRYVARCILVNKIEAIIQGERLKERQRVEKLRRQKRPRSKAAKLRILEAKRRHSQKKSLRLAQREIE